MTTHSVSIRDGSMRALLKVSFPLMLSWLSVVAMTFVDRLYLAHYSLEALNATVTGSVVAWAFTYSLLVMCDMSEVLVAQYNGARKYQLLGRPVWQMIWFAGMSIIGFIPLALWGATTLFPATPSGELQATYFKWLVFFGPGYGLVGATSAFFVGQGKSRTYTYVTVIGNLINVILDPILIFGINGWVPEMGVQGAAIATGVGTSLQGVILLVIFLKKDNRRHFGSGLYQFHLDTFLQCVKIGLPAAVLELLEIGGWALFYFMMNQASSLHVLVSGISQSILILFLFFGIGLNRGVSAIAGNLIGVGLKERIPKLVRSGLCLVGGYFLITCIPLIMWPDGIIRLFLANPETLEIPVNWESMNVDDLFGSIRFGLVVTCFYLLFENIRWVYNGLLAAAGDTTFLMYSGVLTLWVLMVIPTYYLIILKHGGITVAMGIWLFYSMFAYLVPFIRYRFGKWDQKDLIGQTN